MTGGPFVSYAQNGEDVVLHRVLHDVREGRYIDVGANDPTVDSVSRAFYDAGWRGITIEPVAHYAQRQRAERPEDLLVEAAVTRTGGQSVQLTEVVGTGLSTLDAEIGAAHRGAGWDVREVQVPTRRLDEILTEAGWQGGEIHFLSVDVEGGEEDVLRSLDLRTWRPWIILAEATRPQSTELTHLAWEPLLTDAGYRFALFDGLSRYYLADEHWDRLHEMLAAPANPLDDFVLHRELVLKTELDHLAGELAAAHARFTTVVAEAERRENAAVQAVLKWRAKAIGAWADRSAGVSRGQVADELTFLRNQTHALTQELDAVRRTLSWRITTPLRAARLLGKRDRP